MPDDQPVRIVIEGEELEDAQALARTSGIDLTIEPKLQFIDPFTPILIAGGLLAVAKFTVDLIDRLRGGIVIDLRPDAKEFIRRDRAVPYGWAIVRAADGSVSINVHDAPKDAAERLLGQMIDGVLKTAASVAKEAAKAFGADKVKDLLLSP